MRGVTSESLIEWDWTNAAPQIEWADKVMRGPMVSASYGRYFGAKEDEGGSADREKDVPFNQKAGWPKAEPSELKPFSSRLSDGFPVDPFTVPAPVAFGSL